jgi:transcriptional regulator with XRE-family HTH domain
MELENERAVDPGFPELTELGKRIEMLRIQRGLSKQHLARHAGTSRQQLWRVMTGKSELTIGLRSRLADVLDIEMPELDAQTSTTAPAPVTQLPRRIAPDFPTYVSDVTAIERTLASMPGGDAGFAIKRRYLDALEDVSIASGIPLGAAFFDVRRRLFAREL